MEAPVNIVVESPDAEKANLVGRAIAQGLKDNFGFEQVVHAHIVTDTPGFRAWTASTTEETEESLLQAMVRHNPGIMQTPVTVMSREQTDPMTDSALACKPALMVGGIGEQGQTFEELRDAAWQRAQATLRPQVEKFAKDIIEMFNPSDVKS